MGKIRSTNQAAALDPVVAPAVDRQLANWGRWCKTSGDNRASGVWRFASRGTRAAAYAVATVVPVDVAQARAVEACVCNASFSPLFRDVLRAHYVWDMHPTRACIKLGLHWAAYAATVVRATVYFDEQYVQRLAAKPLALP